jgi:hypothetical protein
MSPTSKGKKSIHVISFDIPYPPTYGGVIDVFYKLKAFKEAGIKVHLHCFEYSRNKTAKLNDFCESVTYYKRNIYKTNLFGKTPYIVASRSTEDLINNLLKDDYPILFEGLHSCYHLSDKRLKKRKKIVRMHNIEHNYYTSLANVEKRIFKRYYFLNEASKLKRYENVLNHANGIAAISLNDMLYLKEKFRNVKVVSAFHPFESLKIKEGSGKYALYHGTLTVGENNQAAIFLVNSVFNDLHVPLVIAGKNASLELRQAILKNRNIKLRNKVTNHRIEELIENAHINILPTFQATGIKLKLLAALYRGRHCIVNTPMIQNTGLESLCIVKDSAEDLKNEVRRVFSIPFAKDAIAEREKVLLKNGFTNNHNIHQLTEMLFS